MSSPQNAGRIEVTSEQLLNELSEIKDRVGALESVAGIAHQDLLFKSFKEILTTPQRRRVMALCEEPKSKKQLVSEAKFNSPQALDNHLNHLREWLVHPVHIDGVAHFEWSPLFKRLSKAKREALLQ